MLTLCCSSCHSFAFFQNVNEFQVFQLSQHLLKADAWLWIFSLTHSFRFHRASQKPSPCSAPPPSCISSQNAYHCSFLFPLQPLFFTLSYLQPVWYLRQMCDPWLLVNEFPFVQVAKLGPIKTHTEIGSKHPLMALEGKKKHDLIIALIQYETSNIYSSYVNNL